MRKFCTLFVALALVLLCIVLLPTETKAASQSDLTFELNNDGQSYFVSDCKSSASGMLSIPATYNGKPVTSIGDDAFYCCTSLTSVTIPDSVTSIGDYAFAHCDSLTSVTIGNSVTSIGDYAFIACYSLTSITIPDSVTSIGDYAFAGCSSLTSITIPDSVTSIGNSAFEYCDSLTSVTIGNSVTSIGNYAFEYCFSLTSVTIPDSVTSIGYGAFIACDSLTSVTIGNSVTSIGDSAFAHCDSLTSVTISDGATSIGGSAFYLCTSLTSITIPDSVTSIGYSAFAYCDSLTTVIYCGTEEQWNQISIDSYNACLTTAQRSYHNWIEATCATPKTCTVCGETEGTVQHTLVDATCTIPSYCTVPGCGYIAAPALGHDYTGELDGICNRCEHVCGHTYVDEEGNSTNGVCFLCGVPCAHEYDDDQDATCNICGTVSEIGIIASGACGYNLTWILDSEGTLTISGTGDMWEYGLYDPVEEWWENPPWSGYLSSIIKIVIEPGVTGISDDAFVRGWWEFDSFLPTMEGCSNLTSVTIPDSVTYIGAGAFWGSTNLSYNTYDNGLYIGNESNPYMALADTISTTITECQIHPNTKIICGSAFSSCGRLSSITIPDNVTSIGDNAFAWCNNLTSVTIGNSVTNIGEGAFQNCTGLTSVTYCGTAEQWNQISIESGNTALKNVRHNAHAWTSATVAKEPTYVALGEQVSTCGLCGEQKTEPIPAKFYGTSINLGNTLDMYFGFYTGLVDEAGKVVFVREFADGTTETTEAPITSFKKNNSVYDITYTGLAAKEMCDTIHVYVYNSEGTLVGEHSDSIRSYVLRQLREKEYGQEFRTLCVDLLNYGAAAQVEFGYRENDLANKDLTPEELAEGTQTVATYTDKQSIVGNATSYYGTAYILETKISMMMAVRGDRIGADCYALVSYTDHTGTPKSNIRVEGKKNYSVYEFELNEIVVADGRCLLTIEFYKADGTKVLTVQDSMESYTARNAADYPLAEKMLAFSDSAYKYLHRNDK